VIIIAGDSHCDYHFIRCLYDKAIDNNIKDIIICGDFGYWPNNNQGKNFLWNLNNLLKDKDIRIYFVDGNHEDFIELKKLPRDRVSMIPEAHNVFYIPRGITTIIDNKKIVGFGGAASIDREYRVLNKSWFAEETIKDEEIKAMKDINDVDILITHDAPLNLLTENYKNDPLSEINRQQIQTIMNIVKPKKLYHGHYHKRWIDYGYKGTLCNGLHMNYSPSEAYIIEK
jgi:predicted phosphodiesterase